LVGMALMRDVTLVRCDWPTRRSKSGCLALSAAFS
jgi:hypothetical protein